MPVPAETTYSNHTVVSSSTGPFNFDFNYFAATDIEVQVDGVALASSAFSVTPGVAVEYGGFDGGSVTLVTAVANAEVAVLRKTVRDRGSDLTGNQLTAQAVNTMLNKLVMMAQEDSRDFSRSILAAVGALGVAFTPADISTVAGLNTEIEALGDLSVEIAALGAIPSDIAALGAIAGDIAALENVDAEIAVLAPIAANITTVAGIASGVTTVAGIASNVTTVAGVSSAVSTVAGISENVTTVAGIASNVTAVAGDAADIGTVASDLGGSDTIGTVAGSIGNVNAVGGSIGNVNTVGGAITNVNTLAGISTNITTVAGISSDVTAVSGISAEVSTVAADGTDIGTVATNIANVNSVAGISGNVTTVAGISADVTAVAGNAANINAVAAGGAPTHYAVDTDNTVIGNGAGSGLTSGLNNTFYGENAGASVTSGSNNIAIGHGAAVDSATGSNQINIGGVYFHDRIRQADGSTSAPSLSYSGDSDTGWYRVGSNNFSSAIGGNRGHRFGAGYLGFADGSGGSWTTYLYHGGSNVLDLRNGVAAQELRVFESFTNGTNYEVLRIIGNSSRNIIRTASSGTGTDSSLAFGTADTNRWEIDTTGHFLAFADNTYDIGASGANRPRNGYFAGTLSFGAHSAIGAETITGYIEISDSSGTTRKLAVVS